MTELASRRSLIGGIAALPLLGGAAATREATSPALRRLVERHRWLNAALRAAESSDDHQHGRLCTLAGRMRCRIALFSATRIPDVMLKAMALREAEADLDDFASDLARDLADGHAYLDDLAASIALDLMRMTAASSDA